MESETDLSTATTPELIRELGRRTPCAVFVMVRKDKVGNRGGKIQSWFFGPSYAAIGLVEQLRYKLLNGAMRPMDEVPEDDE